jgi:hypothetical protein
MESSEIHNLHKTRVDTNLHFTTNLLNQNLNINSLTTLLSIRHLSTLTKQSNLVIKLQIHFIQLGKIDQSRQTENGGDIQTPSSIRKNQSLLQLYRDLSE